MAHFFLKKEQHLHIISLCEATVFMVVIKFYTVTRQVMFAFQFQIANIPLEESESDESSEEDDEMETDDPVMNDHFERIVGCLKEANAILAALLR